MVRGVNRSLAAGAAFVIGLRSLSVVWAIALFVNRQRVYCNRQVMDDDGLIAAIAAGDDSALRALFLRHGPWLAGRLRSVLSAGDVEDVLQETFIAVWRGAGGYRPNGVARAWLWGIARRQAALFLRRSQPAAPVQSGVMAADGWNGDDATEAALWRQLLAHALGTLGPEGSPEREVWRLMYVEDRPVAEVAALMGVPEGTVKSRAHRARRLLRAALRDIDPRRRGGPATEGTLR
jgi:RNA polymerase sigma-70 factor (ECF subfamily)